MALDDATTLDKHQLAGDAPATRLDINRLDVANRDITAKAAGSDTTAGPASTAVAGPPAADPLADPTVTAVAPLRVPAAPRPARTPAPEPAEPPAPILGSAALTLITIGAVTALMVAANVVTVPWTRHVFDRPEQLIAVGMAVGATVGIAAVLSALNKAANGVILAAATAIGIAAVTVLLVSGIGAVRTAAADPHGPALASPLAATNAGNGRTGAGNPAGNPTSPLQLTGTASPSVVTRSVPPASTPAPTTSTSKAPTAANQYLAAHGRLVLDDRPTANSPAWNGDPAGTGSCQPKADGMHVLTAAAGAVHGCLSATTVGDATVEASMALGSAPAGGVLLRHSGKGSWYAAGVDRSGRAFLTPYTAGAAGADLVSAPVARFDPKAAHLVAVTAVGSALTLYVDGRRIGAASSAGYRSGPVGGFTATVPTASDASATATVGVVLQRLRVWTA